MQTKFIKHSAFAEYIAFIGGPIPLTRYPLSQKYEMVLKEKLPLDSFLFDGKTYSVKTFFYVMKKINKPAAKRNRKLKSNYIDCWVCGYSKKYAQGMNKLGQQDFFLPSSVWGTGGFNVYFDLEDVPSHWGYAVKVLDERDKRKIINLFENLNWDDYLECNKRNKSLKRDVIEKAIIDRYGYKSVFGRIKG